MMNKPLARNARRKKSMLRVKPTLASLLIVFFAFSLQGCSTAVAVVDTAASIVVYTGKTIVNAVDAVTPDIVN